MICILKSNSKRVLGGKEKKNAVKYWCSKKMQIALKICKIRI